MLFKNASIFALGAFNPDDLEAKLAGACFKPIGSAEVLSQGFEPVFEDQLVFRSHGHMLLKFTREKKVVPKSAVIELARTRAEEIEEQQGFAPGKKAMKEIREPVQDELTARALSSKASCRVWIDTKAGRLIVDSTSNPLIDAISTSLVKHAGLELRHLDSWPGSKDRTQVPMWFMDEGDNLPAELTLDDAAQLEMPGALGTLITFRKANLGTTEVLGHIGQGAMVISVAVTYRDRLSFTLCQGGQLRGIRALDMIDEVQTVPDVDAFENDFILAATEIGNVIDYLVSLG
jgi:recombination associated protein RdgC